MANRLENGSGNRKPPGLPIWTVDESQFYVAQNGRPLHEKKAHESVRVGVVFEEVRNTHKDSRITAPKKKMNLSAFREIQNDQEPLFDGLSWVNRHYFKGAAPDHVTNGDVYALTCIGVYMPEYLALRAKNPVEKNAMPNVVGNIYKASEGMRSATRFTLTKGIDDIVITPIDLYQVADFKVRSSDSLLVGEGGVCPASKRLIVNTFEALMYQQGGAAMSSELSRYFKQDEFDNLKKFSSVVANFFQLTRIFKLKVSQLSDEYDELMAAGSAKNSPAVLLIEATVSSLNADFNQKHRQAEYLFNQSLGRDPSQR